MPGHVLPLYCECQARWEDDLKTAPLLNPNAFICRNAFLPCSIRLDKDAGGGKHVPGSMKGRIRPREAPIPTAETASHG